MWAMLLYVRGGHGYLKSEVGKATLHQRWARLFYIRGGHGYFISEVGKATLYPRWAWQLYIRGEHGFFKSEVGMDILNQRWAWITLNNQPMPLITIISTQAKTGWIINFFFDF